MKVWFDADNGPHVLIMRPLLEELNRRGCEVVVTARDRAGTCQLFDLYNIGYETVGGIYGDGLAGKVKGTVRRAAQLSATMRGRGIDVSFGHGSRALPIASRLQQIPSVTMYDYEWVDARLFNRMCHSILLPDAITLERCSEAGIATEKVRHYGGFKEELYLGASELDQTIATDLGLDDQRIKVLLRPPATTAHYHNPESEAILDAVLRHLATEPELQLVYLPRTDNQRLSAEQAGVSKVIIPNKTYDGPSLVGAMDLVLSGGGTMSREAAIMGVPSYSFFRGQLGMVDQRLESDGRLTLLSSPDQVETKLKLQQWDGRLEIPSSADLVASICDQIMAAAS